MKKAMITSLLILSICTFMNYNSPGQEYKKGYAKLIHSAFVLRKKKKYMEGISLIQRAIKIDSSAKYWAYLHIANFASLAHQNNLAFSYLDKVLHSPIAWKIGWEAYTKKGLKPLQSDHRWTSYQQVIDSLLRRSKFVRDSIQHIKDSIQHIKDSIGMVKQHYYKKIQNKIERYTTNNLIPNTWKSLPATLLYDSLQSLKNNYPFHSASHYLCFYITLNDTFKTCYLIQLPKHFDYHKRYPLLIVLHGAVRYNHPPKYADSSFLSFFFTQYSKLSDSLNFISVYPFASPQYNWMTSDKGFSLVPKIIKEMKKCFNIDDSRIYISGHSNGATGSFNYLVKDPTLFAAFSGFNNKPVVMTGGTFIKNAINRNFYNISTDKDYYFPLGGHKKLANKADSLGIEWHNEIYYGFPHWFPKFPQSEEAFEHIFADMQQHIRNPFHHHIYWQCDDVEYGRCDWLKINKLDTLSAPVKWQKPVNFIVTHWVNTRDTSKIIDSTVKAFNFPRKSGAIEADYSNNTFNLKTSCVSSFTLYLSPEMINFNRPVQIFINGHKIFDKKMDFDKAFMLSNFKNTYDRQAIWVNKITLIVNECKTR